MNSYDIVQLADDEWGSNLMEDIAREWFEQHPNCQFVEVREHAGWFLVWHRSMVCISTANDRAILPKDLPRPTQFSGITHRRKSADERKAMDAAAHRYYQARSEWNHVAVNAAQVAANTISTN